ncbi:MAG TPA: hypothetical protein PKD55_21495 [Bellilinea sp.]|nr:hypothetical protein [Bellilinea sp.]
MDFDQALRDKREEEIRASTPTFLLQACMPAFGGLPKSEIELLFGLLEKVGALSQNAGNYELVSKLHITNSKSCRLICQCELRRMSRADLDQRVKQALKRLLRMAEYLAPSWMRWGSARSGISPCSS